MLYKRIISATVAIPLLLTALFWKNPILFSIVAVVAACVSLYEYGRMFCPRFSDTRTRFAFFLALTGGGLLFLYQTFTLIYLPELTQKLAFLDLFSIASVLLASVFLLSTPDLSLAIKKIAISLMGWVYIPLLLSFLIKLYILPNGSLILVLFFLIIFASDTGAYLIGSNFGKNKLLPKISPNKTVEGALGGIVTAILISFLFQIFADLPLSWVVTLLLTVTTTIFSQIGDLIESMLKRFAQVKDSGSFFYGHGGMLDRLDSILTGAPVFFIIYNLYSG